MTGWRPKTKVLVQMNFLFKQVIFSFHLDFPGSRWCLFLHVVFLLLHIDESFFFETLTCAHVSIGWFNYRLVQLFNVMSFPLLQVRNLQGK